MSPLINLLLHFDEPKEIKHRILDEIDVDRLCAMRRVCRESVTFFEGDYFADYFLSVRLPKLISRAKQVKCSPLEFDKHKAWVVTFFKIISLLPKTISFPPAEAFDANENRLTTLLRNFSLTFPMVLSSLPGRLTAISNYADVRIPSFMAVIPTRLLPPTIRGFAELSRRFPIPPLNDAEFISLTEFHISLNPFNLSSGCYASSFIRGISINLLKFTLEKNPDGFIIGPSLISAFLEIQDPVEAAEKVVVFGDWLKEHSKRWSPHSRAHQLMCVLYMAARVDQKSHIDRELVRSWILDDDWKNWNLFAEEVFESGKPIPEDERMVVKEQFAEFFLS